MQCATLCDASDTLDEFASAHGSCAKVPHSAEYKSGVRRFLYSSLLRNSESQNVFQAFDSIGVAKHLRPCQ